MDIQPGKRYFGEDDQPRLVTAADDETVRWYDLFGRGDLQAPRADFEAWAAKSTRRNYVHANGERRIRLNLTDADPVLNRGPGIVWANVETPTALQWSSLADWAAWRKDAT